MTRQRCAGYLLYISLVVPTDWIVEYNINLCSQVKHAYLHEALVNLDPNNPTTRAHIKTVLTGLDASLKQYIMANPNSKMTRNMKLLVMACGNQMQQ